MTNTLAYYTKANNTKVKNVLSEHVKQNRVKGLAFDKRISFLQKGFNQSQSMR
jgi:hypothetical protein